MAAQNVAVDIFSQGMWPQEDARDPLGVWGGRHVITGSAGGGPIKVQFQPGADKAGAYLYTCYFATIAQVTVNESATMKCRLLTNWPDVDDDVGVQGAATLRIMGTQGNVSFTAPFEGPITPMVFPADRFVLLFDPRPVAGGFTIVELEQDRSTDTNLYVFECWGYYWDRQVMSTPGGPRHPGSK